MNESLNIICIATIKIVLSVLIGYFVAIALYLVRKKASSSFTRRRNIFSVKV
jgi:hypothetical protein